MCPRFEPLVLKTPCATLQLLVASNPCARALGLLPQRTLPLDRGLLIPACRSVHTMGMAYAIDVLFIDDDGHLIEVHPALPRWRIAWCRRAGAVLELAAGGTAAAGLKRGDRLPALLPWLGSNPGRREAK